MDILLLGLGIGMLSLIAPGPINLSLVQVGARLGRRPALRGAAGIVGGDSLLGVVAVGIVVLGAALPAQLFVSAQVGAALLLVLIGGVLAAKPNIATASVARIQRPGRAFFVLTSLTPTALGSWIALLAAMPFAADPGQLGLFTAGVLIASMVWHPFLGLVSAAIGARLSEFGQRRLSQFGGLGMAALGLALAIQQLT